MRRKVSVVDGPANVLTGRNRGDVLIGACVEMVRPFPGCGFLSGRGGIRQR